MSINLPHWNLSAGNGCVPDLSHLDSPHSIKLEEGAEEPDSSKQSDLLSTAPNDAVVLPQIQIYEHIDFGGHNEITSLNWHYVGEWWNDKISSIVIYRGKWRFYEHWRYGGKYWDLGPGQHRWVVDKGIPNDIISSFRFVGY